MTFEQPIPFLAEDPETTHIQIRESGEALVRLESGNRVHVSPAYYARGFSFTHDRVLVRQSTYIALLNAARILPSGISLTVWDGFGNPALQRELGQRVEEKFILRPWLTLVSMPAIEAGNV